MNHTWSLAVEEQFYLCWPLLVFLLPRRGLIAACAAFLVVAPAFRAWVSAAYPGTLYFYTLLPSHLDSLAAGSLLAILLRSFPQQQVVRWYAAYAGLGVVALAVLALSFSDALLRLLLPYLCLNVILWPLLLPGGYVARLFSLPAIRYVGKVSYGLYLFHPPVYHLVGAALRRTAAPHWAVIPLELCALAAVAATSWYFLESPLLAYKNRFRLEQRRNTSSQDPTTCFGHCGIGNEPQVG